MSDYVINWIVFGMGILAMIFSAAISIRFMLSKTLLSRAIGMQIAAEFIALTATNVFAYFSLIDQYNSMGPLQAAAIRVLIFCTSLFTSIHLYFVLRPPDDS
jgi:hypothetical protein